MNERARRRSARPALPPVMKPTADRVAMTVSCRDCDALPKVEGAGTVFTDGSGAWQRMFNGIEVEHGGYHGDWMSNIIQQLRGHHEPQEELVFSRILDRLQPRAVMIELGCFWAYYSLWFAQQLPAARVILSEPDPEHLELARRNFARNGLSERAAFHRAAAGLDQLYRIQLESTGEMQVIKGLSVESLMRLNDLPRVDLLHLDVQGAECDVLASLESHGLRDRLRFVFASTHHHSITGDPLTHERCLDTLNSLGAHIICEHTVEESFSGDGLIVASFSDEDSDVIVPISRNTARNALFRPLVYDLAELGMPEAVTSRSWSE